MARLLSLLAQALLLAGCTTLSEDYELKEQGDLKRAYHDCLARFGNDASQCAKARDRMLEQEEFQMMDSDG